MTYYLTRVGFVLAFVAGIFFAYAELRTVAILVVAAGIVAALANYGHQATTLYLAERRRALLAQTRETT
jgi:hypothetical protein